MENRYNMDHTVTEIQKILRGIVFHTAGNTFDISSRNKEDVIQFVEERVEIPVRIALEWYEEYEDFRNS